ncbi:MAG: hypothetical protein LBE76_03220 [Nitrososphaerota archaeon]|jgi:hypothetical protein|nr:hypothetical protein [Nitrososphaerota archaeon]
MELKLTIGGLFTLIIGLVIWFLSPDPFAIFQTVMDILKPTIANNPQVISVYTILGFSLTVIGGFFTVAEPVFMVITAIFGSSNGR